MRNLSDSILLLILVAVPFTIGLLLMSSCTTINVRCTVNGIVVPCKSEIEHERSNRFVD